MGALARPSSIHDELLPTQEWVRLKLASHRRKRSLLPIMLSRLRLLEEAAMGAQEHSKQDKQQSTFRMLLWHCFQGVPFLAALDRSFVEGSN